LFNGVSIHSHYEIGEGGGGISLVPEPATLLLFVFGSAFVRKHWFISCSK
jgi:hypothetical protein